MNMLLADTLCRIKNAYVRKQLHAVVQNSKFMRATLYLLYKLGYISSFSIIDNSRINVFLKYVQGKSAIRNYSLVSVPGKRFYLSHKTLKKFRNRLLVQKAGFLIISTSQGLMTDQQALVKQLGGELVFYVY